MINPIDGVRRRKEICRPQRKSFHRVIPKMLVEPCPPGGTQRIAWLQHRFEPRSKTSAHEAKVAAVFARHQFEDRIRLAMALDAEHDPFIGPLHGSSPDSPVYIYVITAPTRSAATLKDWFKPILAGLGGGSCPAISWETPAPWPDSAQDHRPTLCALSRKGTGAPWFRRSPQSPCGRLRRSP